MCVLHHRAPNDMDHDHLTRTRYLWESPARLLGLLGEIGWEQDLVEHIALSIVMQGRNTLRQISGGIF
jgi:hypothetical protein